MQHYHTTNTRHSHGVTLEGSYPNNMTTCYTGYSGGTVRAFLDTGVGPAISINQSGDDSDSGNARVIGTGATKTNTESNDNNAIENRPKNYTVKIWKRTA